MRRAGALTVALALVLSVLLQTVTAFMSTRTGLMRRTAAPWALQSSVAAWSELSRRDLQGLAKANGIKANLASAEIIKQLEIAGKVGAPAPASSSASASAVAPKVAPKAAPAVAPKAAPKAVPAAAPKATPKAAPKAAATARAAPIESADGVLWSSDDYGKDELEEMWRSIPGPLLTVGSKGVTDSHARSLEDLLRGHTRVRVKFSSDRLDAAAMAQAFLAQSQTLASGAELLLVKRRECLLQRSPNAPRGLWPKVGSARAGAGKNAQHVCHGCGRIGHHRIECPNSRQPDFCKEGMHPAAAKLLAAASGAGAGAGAGPDAGSGSTSNPPRRKVKPRQ